VLATSLSRVKTCLPHLCNMKFKLFNNEPLKTA
jgi:hypothetical protein